MYVVTDKGVVMIDSPWDTTQFQPLLDSIRVKHNKNVVLCIATHFHEDRTGGLEYYRQQGIKTYTTSETDELSKKRGMKRAEFLIDKDTVFTTGQYSFQTYFPGQGHAPDNIVIWFEKEKILYGGCLVKSVEDSTLGNLADADVKDYATTIKNIQKKCKKIKYIIPGHNDWTSTKSLEHTLKWPSNSNRKTTSSCRWSPINDSISLLQSATLLHFLILFACSDVTQLEKAFSYSENSFAYLEIIISSNKSLFLIQEILILI